MPSGRRAPGGLEVWDKRVAGAPVRRSPLEWGLTGFAQQDAIQVTPVALPSDLPPATASAIKVMGVSIQRLPLEPGVSLQ